MKTYHIFTFGCQMNRFDSERIATVLEKAGYEADVSAEALAEADLIVVNMCSVRQSAVDRVHFLAHKFRKLKAKTILTGCILKKDRRVFEKSFDFVIDISEATSFEGLTQACRLGLAERAAGRVLKRASRRSERSVSEEASLPSGYVQIMTGCNNFCSYCVVPYTRGRETSRPVKDIIAEVKKIIKNGSKEIWLLGQNVNSYVPSFPKLLKLVNDIPGKFELNFLTAHPKDFSDELIKVMAKCEKLSKRLNLPIQSGDDKILKKMNRPYTVAQYKNLVKKIRKAIPDISLSTDVIVGFPGETKKQFENTVKTLKKVGFDIAFVNKYSRRPGTVAAKLKDNVPWAEKKRREKILIDLINR